MWYHPALTEENTPGEAASPTVPGGGDVWNPRPGQETEPPVSTQQAGFFAPPAEANAAEGCVERPSVSWPQHSTEPSLLKPQLCSTPEVTETNVPGSGEA